MSLTETIREYAFSLGFDLVGFTTAESFEHGEEMLRQWVKNGYAGEMKYMERAPERRAHPQEILPGAKTIISLAINYYQADEEPNSCHSERSEESLCSTNDLPILSRDSSVAALPQNDNTDRVMGKIAKYARGVDYHEVMDKKLEQLEKFIQAQAKASGKGKTFIPDAEVLTKRYVDTGPLLEREIAQRAGLGFIGENTNLITRKFGSWVFLSEILTTLELDYDKPARGTCGTCTLCIDACPTQAIVNSNQLDSRLCISYLTIELKNAIPEKLRALMGNWIFGCDICQDVCPFNHKPKTTTTLEFLTTTPLKSPSLIKEGEGGSLADLKTLLLIREDKQFKEKFKHSPISRPKRSGILRNATITAANSKDKSLLPVLQETASADPSDLVRSHAQWAVEKLSK